MVALDILSLMIGVLCVAVTLNDIFQSVVMPRATGRRFRISFYVWRWMWYAWPRLAWRFYSGNPDQREEFFAVFAPLMLILMMALWVALLIFGFGLLFWAMRGGIAPSHSSFATALYFAGTSLLTVGFGDIVGRDAGPRLASVLAALVGLSFLSMITAFLFAIFGSFQNRETFVVTTSARAGAPPSGVNLLAIAGYSLTRDDLSALMIDAQHWAASVMESHLAYPMLAFFRSSHDDQSWVGTLGTLLDAATLLMTTVVGRHATRDLSRYFRVPVVEEAAGIERPEFEQACDRLAAAGYTLRDRNEAWQRFSSLRSSYAAPLSELARFFQIPPLQWIGDRSMITMSPHG
jgi:hypothetical protein